MVDFQLILIVKSGSFVPQSLFSPTLHNSSVAGIHTLCTASNTVRVDVIRMWDGAFRLANESFDIAILWPAPSDRRVDKHKSTVFKHDVAFIFGSFYPVLLA